MAHSLYTHKTPTNQALTARYCGNRITLPVLLPVLLVTLLILSACGGGGGATPTATPTPPATCATNPFGDTCTSEEDAVARDTIIKKCIIGSNADSAECVIARREEPCIATPFIPTCSSRNSTFVVYVDTARTERRNFCEIEANATHKLCVTSIANICDVDIFDELCPASTPEQQEAFCRKGTNAKDVNGCAAVVQRVCDGTQDLFERICPPDTLAQQRHCRMGTNAADVPNCTAVVTGICTNNPFDGICAGMFRVDEAGRAEFCRTGNNLITFASNCTQIANDTCETKLFDPICKDRVADQLQACNGDPADLTNVGAVATDCIQYVDGICGYGRVGGSNPFAPICTDEDISKYSTAITSVRVAFCQANIFHASCETGYINQRVRACHLNGVLSDADPRCPAIIADNCPSSGTRNAACHTVVTLTGASITDPITNYVEATADALKLGFDQSNVPANISDFTSGTIHLSDLTDVSNSDGNTDGVGFATFTDSNGRNSEGEFRQQKFYAGLLTGNTLATRVTENLKNAKWPAKLAIYNEVNLLCLSDKFSSSCGSTGNDGRLIEPAEFTLLVSFDGTIGSIRADGIPVIGDYLFAIDARFNGAGNIYGNTRLSVARRAHIAANHPRFKDGSAYIPDGGVTNFRVDDIFVTEASDGSITGLIGQKGLIAAFVSDGVNNRLGEYAGGLVATNPNNGVSAPDDCTAAGSPFDARCVDDDVRIMLCSTRDASAGTGTDFTENCTDDSDVVAAICAGSGEFANPFDAVICPNPQAEVQQAFITNCLNTDMSLRAGADCDAVLACTGNPFTASCDTTIYASARVAHLEYCRSSVAVAGTDRCLLAVTYCASASDTNCGALPTSYCLGATGRTITGDTSITCGTRVTTHCGINPLNPLCSGVITEPVTLKGRRENFCRIESNANNPDCALTIAGYCDAATTQNQNVFDNLCLNRVHFRYNVIARACDDEDRDDGLDNLCNNPHAYDIQRLEHCKTVDFKRAGCGVTISEERQTMLEITCGDDDGLRGTNRNDPICTAHNRSDHHTNLNICGADDRAGTNPASPICEIESQALITVAVLCGQGFKDGTIGTIGTNPFSAICADDLFNPVPCPTCASISDATERATEMTEVRDNAWKVAKENFCREGFRAITRAAIAGDTTPVYTASTDCAPIITAFCPATPSADLFDDLCDGTDYAADRTTHCGTSDFTHAKCGGSPTNIGKAADICGTEAVPGTNPFDEVCRDKTLSPDITLTSLVATQRTFCRASANVGKPICADTIANFCNVPISSDVIFDDLCGGADYTGARLAYCIHPTRSQNEECETDANNKIALMALCGDADTAGTNPFSVACTTASLLRLEIDALCGGGRNSQIPLCTKENAIPAIDRASITASQENFCRGNLANTACEETIADFCDFAIGTNVLDPLCGGNEYYQEIRLITCLNPDVSHVECRGATGIVATLCPTDGNGTNRHESCPIIVDHALYRTPVNEFDEKGGGFVGGFNFDALKAVGVVSKSSTKNFATNVQRTIGFATDAPATLITAKTDRSGLSFGTLPTDLTEIRNGGAPVQIRVRVNSNTVYRIPNTNDGYALAVAAVTTQAPGRYTIENKLYAGVLANTNSFGAPNFDNPPTATWNASMNLIMNGGSTRASANFDLKVNFISQRITTLTNDFAQFTLTGAYFDKLGLIPITGRLTVDASFSRLGFIHGATNLETGFFMPSTGDFTGENGGATLNSAGKLVGWIGNTKLVGAFASNAGSAEAYIGGFTATPSATPSPTSFTAGGTDDLTLTGKTAAATPTTQLPHPLGITSNTKFTIGSTTNGFALASENIADGAVKLYAGILSGTNLGNPLFDNSVTGVWHATMNLLMFGDTATADFDLNVDFNTRTIETLADSPAEFAFADIEYEVIQRSAKNSAVTALTLNGAQLYLKDAGSSIDARVLASDIGTEVRPTNCVTGAALNIGDRIPLCEGGGRPIYARDGSDNVIRKNGIPLIATTTATATVSTAGRLTVNGRFSSTGKISGTTNIQIGEAGSTPELAGGDGTLTGLIGENGLVAAFISDDGSPYDYAGGFTALGGVCTIGGTPFVKTSCPDTNINARDLRLRLCAERHPVAMADFAANCTGDATITALVCADSGTYANPFDTEFCPTPNPQSKTAFIDNCVTNPAQADACGNQAVRDCLADPYAAECLADYTSARPSHQAKCGTAEAENRQDPTCENFRTFLAGCAVASPNVAACGTVVNDYCFGGARRTTGGTAVTCGSLITSSCNGNPFSSPRCTDNTYVQEKLDACSGDLANLPMGTTVSDCNTLGVTVQICGSPTSVGSNPFAPICSNAQGNPYFETAQLEVIQATFCRQSERSDRNEKTMANTQNCNGLASPGMVKYWRLNALREVAVPQRNEDGSFKINSRRNSVTKLVNIPLDIKPANMVRQSNAAVNYIVGGTTALELGGAPNPAPDLDNQGNPIPSTIITNTPTSINNASGLTLSDFDGNEDAASGFAFASATFATRTLTVQTVPYGNIMTHTVGGTKLYAGLLAGTDVGAPLTEIQTTVEWSGKIDAIFGSGTGDNGNPVVSNSPISQYDTKDFTLLVSFYGGFGFIKSKAPIALADNATFNIDGRFTDGGLIYGKTSILNGNNVTVATGSLTGLIGADGAVAAFISDDPNPLTANKRSPAYYGNYAGGFVALPPSGTLPARADFADWLGSFESPDPTPLTRAFNALEFDAENNKQYFIHGNISGLTASNDINHIRPVVNLTLDSAFDDGNIYDGVSYLRGTENRRYAGLLLGTDLGAPLADVAGTSTQWAGVFRDVRFSYTEPSKFTLTVRFTADGGTLDALLAPEFGTNRSAINGLFDTSGVISGQVIGGNYADDGTCVTDGLPTIESRCFTNDGSLRFAKLTGIIGEQGAVAAFITDDSVSNNTQAWAGGFVATPDFCGNTPGTEDNPNCNTNRADWVGSFGSTAPPATIAASTAGTGIFGGFLDIATGAEAIVPGNLKTAPNGATPASSNFLNRSTAALDGFIFISGYNGANHQVFIGIRPTTNLARPLTAQPAISAWPGFYYDSIAAANTAVTFNIDFSNRSIGTSIADDVSDPPTFDLGFTRAGAITGTVTKNSLEATARGLIGQQGLIGAFVDTGATSGNVFHGGFVATNPGHSN